MKNLFPQFDPVEIRLGCCTAGRFQLLRMNIQLRRRWKLRIKQTVELQSPGVDLWKQCKLSEQSIERRNVHRVINAILRNNNREGRGEKAPC